MHLRDAFQHTVAHFTAGNAVTWIGPPGFGKTETVGKLLAWMKKAYPGVKLGVSTIFMATQSPIGFSGLPWKGTMNYGGKDYTITDPAIPQWFIAFDLETGEAAPADQFAKVLLVIEEWGQGDLETKRAGAELLRAGGAGKFYLPKGSFRLALSNNDTRDGVTKEFDFVINRRSQIDITGDVDVWIEDFADKPQDDGAGRVWNIMPATKAWAKQHPEALFEPKPEKQGPWCTPRSMTMADRYAQVMAELNHGVMPVNDGGFMGGLAGTIGMAACTSYVNHLQFQLELPSYETVVGDPAGTEVPKRADLLMLMAYTLAGRCQTQDLAPVLQYVSKMPKDMAVTFVSSLLRRDYKGIINQPAMQAWVSKNAQLVSIIASLAA